MSNTEKENLSALTGGDLIFYQTEDGQTRLQAQLKDETVWLTQKQMAELFQKDVRTINEHIQNIFDEGELQRGATIRKFRIVQSEGTRSVERETKERTESKPDDHSSMFGMLADKPTTETPPKLREDVTT